MIYSSTVPALEQYVLARFIADGAFERHLSRMRRIYRRRRDVLIEELSCFGDEIEILGVEAGVHLLVRLCGGQSEREVVELARSNGILLSGISEYIPSGADPGLFGDAIVVNFAGVCEEDIRRAGELLRSEKILQI